MKLIFSAALCLMATGCAINEFILPEPKPVASISPAVITLEDQIDIAVKAYSKKAGFPCGEITSKYENEHSTIEVPKFEVACDNGKSKFVWVKYRDGSTAVLPLL